MSGSAGGSRLFGALRVIAVPDTRAEPLLVSGGPVTLLLGPPSSFQWVQERARELAFLPSSQAWPMLPAWGPHTQNHCPTA